VIHFDERDAGAAVCHIDSNVRKVAQCESSGVSARNIFRHPPGA
jgi:hypothetical protein